MPPTSRRFTTYMKNVRVGNFFGGLPIKQQREQLKDKDKCPHIIVGTPGRVKGVRAAPCSCPCAWPHCWVAGIACIACWPAGLSSRPCSLHLAGKRLQRGYILPVLCSTSFGLPPPTCLVPSAAEFTLVLACCCLPAHSRYAAGGREESGPVPRAPLCGGRVRQVPGEHRHARRCAGAGRGRIGSAAEQGFRACRT